MRSRPVGARRGILDVGHRRSGSFSSGRRGNRSTRSLPTAIAVSFDTRTHLLVADVFAERVRQATQSEHPHARARGPAAPRGPSTCRRPWRRASEHRDLGRGLVGRAAHRRVDALGRRDARAPAARSIASVAQRRVVDRRRVDERRRAVRDTASRAAAPPPSCSGGRAARPRSRRRAPARGPHRGGERPSCRAPSAVREPRQQRGHVHPVALVEMDPSAEGGDRDAGEPPRISRPAWPGHAGRREPRQVA